MILSYLLMWHPKSFTLTIPHEFLIKKIGGLLCQKSRANIDGELEVFQEDIMASTFVRKYVPTILVDENEDTEDITERLRIVFDVIEEEDEVEELGEWEDGADDTEDELIPGFASSDDNEGDSTEDDDDYT